MKKSFIAILLVLILSISSVFALDGFTFSAGFGFDARKVKEIKSTSLAFEGGVKYPIGDGFSAYTDVGFRFVGKYNAQKIAYGINARAGVIYGLRFTNKPEFETYLGGGVSYAITYAKKEGETSFNSLMNLGLGFKLVAAYRINNSLALTLTELPDFHIFNNGRFELGFSSTTLLGAMFKF